MLILEDRIWTLILHCSKLTEMISASPPRHWTELRHRLGCIYSDRCRISTYLCQARVIFPSFICNLQHSCVQSPDAGDPAVVASSNRNHFWLAKTSCEVLFHHFSHTKHCNETPNTLNMGFVLDVFLLFPKNLI